MIQWKIFLVFFFIFGTFANPNCPANCEQCSQDGFMCFICKADFEISVTQGCIKSTIQNCILYGPMMECFRCQPLYYPSPDGTSCLRNTFGCLSEGDGTECFQCGFGTVPKDGKCVGVLNCATPTPSGGCSKCLQGFQLAGGICKNNAPGCLQVKPDGTCNKCAKGFVFSGYRCFQQKKKIKNCIVQYTENKCQLCKSGYNMVQGTQCLLTRQLSGGTGPSSPQGPPPSSSQIDGIKIINNLQHNLNFASVSNQNNGHANGFNPNAGGNFGGFDSNFNGDFGGFDRNVNGNFGGFDLNAGGNGFDLPPPQIQIQNCQSVEGDRCVFCTYGFYPKDKKCAEVSKLCDGHDLQSGKCFGCKFGLTLDQNGACIDINCNAPGKEKCQSCKPSFKPNQNGVCQQFDPNCVTSSNGRCQSCKPTFYADKVGKCKSLPPNCVTPNIQTGACLECVKDFEILAPGNPCTKKIVIQNCQVPDQKNPGKCLICVQRFFPDGNKCSRVSDQCKDYNPQNGKCTTCATPGLNIEDGRCVDPNCASRNNDICSNCKPNFIFNSAQKLCKFNDPNCRNLGPTSCRQCKTGFYLTSQNNCQTLPQNCQQADQSGVCTLCVAGFQLNQRGCIRPPPPPSQPPVSQPPPVYQPPANPSGPQNFNQGSYQPQGSSFGAQTISSSSSSNDLNCRQFSNGRCSKCSNRFYVGSQGRCVSVNPLCKENNQMGDCTSCYPGYRVNGGRCIVGAPTDANCKTFTGTVCSECYKGYFFNSATKQCKKVNPLCKSSNTLTGACTSCYPGYSLNQVTGNCQVSIKDPNCRNFAPNGNCLACSARYYVNTNGKCVPANPLCKEYNPLNGACTLCYPGYGLSGNTCLQGVSQDPNCKTFQGTNCQDCVNGFFIGPDGKCKQASPLCKTFDPRSGACLTCYNGYEVSNGACVISKSQDPNCKNYNNNFCVACYAGYLAINGKCMMQNPLCKTLDNNGGCLSCWPGYGLVGNNCAVQAPNQGNSGNDPYCQKFINGVCQQCSNGYYYNSRNQICQQVDPICKTHDMSGGFCTSCYDGYTLSDKKCIQSVAEDIPYCMSIGPNGLCEECDEGYYLDRSNQCKVASAYCKTYNKMTGQCTECNAGYFFQDNDCIYPALYDSNCQRYESSYCSRCRKGFYISNYSCMPVDQNCIEFNYRSNQCQACAHNMQAMGAGCM